MYVLEAAWGRRPLEEVRSVTLEGKKAGIFPHLPPPLPEAPHHATGPPEGDQHGGGAGRAQCNVSSRTAKALSSSVSHHTGSSRQFSDQLSLLSLFVFFFNFFLFFFLNFEFLIIRSKQKRPPLTSIAPTVHIQTVVRNQGVLVTSFIFNFFFFYFVGFKFLFKPTLESVGRQ